MLCCQKIIGTELFFLWNLFLIVYSKYECSSNSSTVYLQTDEIAFFSSVIPGSGTHLCNTVFMFNGIYNEDIRCVAMFRQFDQWNNYYPSTMVGIFNTTTFLPVADDDSAYYVEGYVIFENQSINKCALESISKNEPFEFTDENQVLYLTNTYSNLTNTSVTFPCKWLFTSPVGYGFKIVVEIFEADISTQLLIENRTDILMNQRSFKLKQPIYNSDTFIQIHLNNTAPNLPFQAYISIVKNNATQKKMHCNVNETQRSWGNYGMVMYGNNQQCEYDLVIESETEILVDFENYALEDSDFVAYYDESNTMTKYSPEISVNMNSPLIFSPYKNGTKKTVKWIFESDGSVTGFGFNIEFETAKCNCSKKNIPCGQVSTIMNVSIPDPRYFCGNLQCEFILEPCLSNVTALYLDVWPYPTFSTSDIFRVLSNGSLVYEMYYSNIKQTEYIVYLDSFNENILKITTFYSQIGRYFSFGTVAFQPPPISARVTLTRDTPSYIIDTTSYQLIVIEISEEFIEYNYVVEIHRYFGSGIALYTNERLTHLLNESCSNSVNVSYTNLYACTISNYKTFVIFGTTPSSYYPYAAIQVLNTHKKCVFDKRIFPLSFLNRKNYIDNIPPDLTISALSTPDLPCLITLLIDVTLDVWGSRFPVITKVWTTSKYENVKIFAGIKQNQSLFEYNEKTQHYWKNIIMSTYAFTVEIPKNSTALIVVSSIPTERVDVGYMTPLRESILNVTQFPYKSIATTSCFGLSEKNCPKLLYQSYAIGEYAVKFTVIYLNLSIGHSVRFKGGSTSYNLTSVGDSYVFRNQFVRFGYTFEDTLNFNYTGTADNGVILFIETDRDI